MSTNSEEWYNVEEKLPEIGQRVRVLVVKEMVYKGQLDDNSAQFMYDQEGEHGIYAWSSRVKGHDDGTNSIYKSK